MECVLRADSLSGSTRSENLQGILSWVAGGVGRLSPEHKNIVAYLPDWVTEVSGKANVLKATAKLL